MDTLGTRIELALKEKGAIQADLATACDVTAGAITQWKSGKTKMNAASAIRAASFLGVNMLWLTEGTGPMRPPSDAAEPGPDFVPVARVLLKLEAGVTGYQVQQLDGDGPPIFFRRDFLTSKGWRAERLFALVERISNHPDKVVRACDQL